MRRPAVVSAVLFVAVTAAALGFVGPIAFGDPVEAQQGDEEADWREYDADDEFEIDEADGLNDEELEAVVSRAMVRVEEIRGIEFEERPPVTVITRSEFQEEYAGFGAEPTEEAAAFENAKYRALFLAGEDVNAAEARAENQGTSVMGFYEPSTGEIVLVAEGDQPRMNETILAHELYHAYQDERWGLANYDAATQDGRNAELGLIEGDAVYVETLYDRRCGEEWECLSPPGDGTEPGEADRPDRPANVGILLLDFQPYDDGPVFVESIHENEGWKGVDALYDVPPETAEQVISSGAYPDDDPREVGLDDDHGEAWERIEPDGRPDHDRLGMAAITTMFVHPLYEGDGEPVVAADDWFTTDPDEESPPYGALNYESEYATGWEGDRFHAYQHEDGATGYVWRIAWESPEDAERFLEGFDALIAYWGGERTASDTYAIEEGGYRGAYHVASEDDVVTVTHAPTVDALPEVYADAEPDSGDPVPEETDGEGEEGPTDELPGFGIAVAVVALLAATYLVARR
ncbi:Hvo_1808 family surface protein [Halalkalicoccus ordinarius]|uniref:Hvo_1808 family surface protein n=1 Tax=Halalkalicoccus ordinarius TaxID=3116651 RepID=UPI00300E9766